MLERGVQGVLVGGGTRTINGRWGFLPSSCAAPTDIFSLSQVYVCIIVVELDALLLQLDSAWSVTDIVISFLGRNPPAPHKNRKQKTRARCFCSSLLVLFSLTRVQLQRQGRVELLDPPSPPIFWFYSFEPTVLNTVEKEILGKKLRKHKCMDAESPAHV